MRRQPSDPSIPANATHARVLFWASVVIGLMCIASICAAEVFMPENAAGRQGVIAFYRAFGPFLVIESALAGWAYAYLKQMR